MNQDRYQEFFEEMEEWVKKQIPIFANATATAYETYQNSDQKQPEARDAAIVYQSRLEAYEFLAGKFMLFHQGKKFHDLPEGFLKKKKL